MEEGGREGGGKGGEGREEVGECIKEVITAGRKWGVEKGVTSSATKRRRRK